MQKSNRFCSLKRTLALLTLLADFMGVYEVAAQPKKQKVDESVILCDGNELKESVRNPTCRGWQENPTKNSSFNEYPWYLSNYPKECGVGVDTLIRCYFSTPKAACKANAKIAGMGPTKLPKPFCGCGVLANPTSFRCAWCEKGEMGCKDEKFIPSEECGGGTHVISYELIPPGAYLSYCNESVSGPYSDIPDKYKVCGTTYYTAL